MKILVTGGRDYQDKERVESELHALMQEHAPITHVITGAAQGADYLATAWAAKVGIQVVECIANWHKHKKAAGAIRNSAMLELLADGDMVVAFPGGRGTADMVRKAKQWKFPVHEVSL